MKALALLLVAASAAAQPQNPVLAPCDVPGVTGKARCGTVDVWENRDARAGRRIGLKVIVLPATGLQRASDAIAILAGGPGDAAATGTAHPAAQHVVRKRGLLDIDQRGGIGIEARQHGRLLSRVR